MTVAKGREGEREASFSLFDLQKEERERTKLNEGLNRMASAERERETERAEV